MTNNLNATTRQAQSKSSMGMIISTGGAVVFLAAIYTHKSFVFPYDFYIIPGLLGLFLATVSRQTLVAYLLLSIFLLIHFYVLAFSGVQNADLLGQFRSTGLFVMTLAATLGGLAFFEALGRERFFAMLMALIYLLFLGSLLEHADIIRSLSDAFRLSFYDSQIVYGNDLRDVQSFGSVRPKLFSSEPSHLAKFTSVVCAAGYLMSNKRNQKYLIILVVIASYFTIRSVALAPGMFFILIYVFLDRSSTARLPFIVRSLLFFLLIVFISAVAIEMKSRLGLADFRAEASAYIRIVQPYLQAAVALSERPLFGFGLGSESAISRLGWEVLMTNDAPDYILLNPDALTAGSFLFSVPWQFGIVGTVLVLTFVGYFIAGLSSYMVGLIFFYIIVLGLTVSDIHTPMTWGYLSILLAASRLRLRD